MEKDGGIDISGMSDADKKDVDAYIQQSNHQLTINQLVSKLTSTCWTMCITPPISQGKLTAAEESCTANCVARWMDSQSAIIKALTEEEMRKRR